VPIKLPKCTRASAPAEFSITERLAEDLFPQPLQPVHKAPHKKLRGLQKFRFKLKGVGFTCCRKTSSGTDEKGFVTRARL
jgi:hypothetical protein